MLAIGFSFSPNLSFLCHCRVLLGLQVFHVIGWLWTANWVSALGQCVLAGAFASFYWTQNSKVLWSALLCADNVHVHMQHHNVCQLHSKCSPMCHSKCSPHGFLSFSYGYLDPCIKQCQCKIWPLRSVRPCVRKLFR